MEHASCTEDLQNWREILDLATNIDTLPHLKAKSQRINQHHDIHSHIITSSVSAAHSPIIFIYSR
jgi:hypothetical protein